jgi:outer membrane protein TolC
MRIALLGAMLLALEVLGGIAYGAPPPELPDRPLTLEDCTAIALARNPQIAASEQRVVSAQAGVVRARSSYYPQLSLAAVEGRTGGSALSSGTSTGSRDHTREELDLSLGMTLWQAGRKEAVGQSRSLLTAAGHDQATTTQNLVEQVANDYYGVLATQQLVGVTEAGVESAQGHLEQVQAFIEAGAAADVDVFPAQDDLARAQLDLIDARSNAQLAMAGLKNSMGVPPATVFTLAESPAPEERAIPSLEDALATALAGRREVLATRASTQAARYALAQAEIERGPVASVAAAYDRAYTQWSYRDSAWEVAAAVSWPLLDGGATKAAAAQARAQLRQSEADLQGVINQVELEVDLALVEANRTRERVQASAVSVTAAEARLAAAEGKYDNAVGILLEVIDARVAVTDARANQVRSRYDYQTALVALERAMGTLAAPEAAGAGGNNR